MPKGRPKEQLATAKTEKSKKSPDTRRNGNGANLGFEAQLFLAADKLRKNLEPSEYKHVVLGLIFLKYISDAFEAKRAALLAEDPAAAEDPDEYLRRERVLGAEGGPLVAPAGQRQAADHRQARSTTPWTPSSKANPGLKGVLPKDYDRPALDKVMLGELIDLVSGIAHGRARRQARRTSSAASTNTSSATSPAPKASAAASSTRRARSSGCWSRCWSRTRAASTTPAAAPAACSCSPRSSWRPTAGSIGDIAIYGQESQLHDVAARKMNLAIRGIEADLRWNNEGSFHKDELTGPAARLHPRQSAVQHLRLGRRPAAGRCALEVRRAAGRQRQLRLGPALLYHLAPNGTAGVVLANGSMSSTQSGEGEIRKAMVEADLVDCMVALPGQLFYSTQIPVCLWFLLATRTPGGKLRDRRGEALFIDARKLGTLVDRTRRELTDEDIAKIAGTYHAWRERTGAYADVPGFCKSAKLDEIRGHNHVLTPGRYVGAEDIEDDDVPFAERLRSLGRS